MPRRFVHAADLHLDSPFAGVGSLRPGLAERLAEAQFAAWRDLVRLCLDERAEFLILAGDTFDRGDGTALSRARLEQGIADLHAAGIPVLIAHGNHDPLKRTSPFAKLAGVHVFPARRQGVVELDAPGGPVTVHGASFGDEAEENGLHHLYERGDRPGLHVGVLHCSLGVREGHGRYAPCSVADLVDRRMDYWALGHIHAHAVEAAPVPIVYAGALQGRSPKPSERGPHGAVVVEFDDDRVVDHAFVALDHVRFAAIEVAIDGLEDDHDLRQALAEGARRAADDADGRLLILRATLTGRGPVHALLRGNGYLDDLQRALEEATDDDVVWERIDSAAAPAIDEDELRRGSAFAAEVIAELDALAADPAAIAALLGELARPFTDRALNGIAAEDASARLAAARSLVLGLLVDGEEDEA